MFQPQRTEPYRQRVHLRRADHAVLRDQGQLTALPVRLVDHTHGAFPRGALLIGHFAEIKHVLLHHVAPHPPAFHDRPAPMGFPVFAPRAALQKHARSLAG